MPSSILLANNMGCLCKVVNDVTKNIDASKLLESISPYDLNSIDFMFGEMLYLTTSIAYYVLVVSTAQDCYILPNVKNKV